MKFHVLNKPLLVKKMLQRLEIEQSLQRLIHSLAEYLLLHLLPLITS